MIQTQPNGEKPHFGPDLGPLCPYLGHQDFFVKLVLTNIVPSYHPMQFKGKLMNQT